jgi:hypothetical protein
MNMEWISVKDRLPKNDDRVIMLSKKAINEYCYPYTYLDACEMGFYSDGKWYSDTRFEIIDNSSLEIRKRLTKTYKDWRLDDVTHWMPLPEAP